MSSNTVRGVVSRAKGAPVEVTEVVVPEPGPGEARVTVQACGVCHTDLHYREGAINDEFPFLLGHEAAGVVESVGPEVRDGMSEDFWDDQLSKPENWDGGPKWPNLEDDEDHVSQEDATWEGMSNADWAEENEWGEHQPQFGPQSGADLE